MCGGKEVVMSEWIVVESGGRKRALQVRNIVDVITTPAREAGWDEEMGEKIYPAPMKVEVVTTAAASTYEDGGAERGRLLPRTSENFYSSTTSLVIRYAGGHGPETEHT
jgi:hypothetical protein